MADPNDPGEVTSPGTQAAGEPLPLPWPPPEEPAAPHPAELGAEGMSDLERGTLRPVATQLVNPQSGYLTLAIFGCLLGIGVCGVFADSLVWELAALTVMIAVPAAGAVGFMGWKASQTKKDSKSKPSTSTPV